MNTYSTTKNYDSEFCGSIPLNFINLIQPHGMMMVVNKEMEIIQLSENVEQLLGISPEQIVGKKFNSILKEEDLEGFEQKIQRRKTYDNVPHVLHLKGTEETLRFTVVIHFHEQYFLLELEPLKEVTSDITFISAYQDIKNIIAILQQSKGLKEFGKLAAEEIRSYSGFDRVMIYKFDEQWNGSVIAEAQDGSLESYLDLKFPASDIPKQARQLYFKTPYRIIPDVNFTPVKLYPIVNSITKGFTDISDCTLRSVPPVHIEYLNNMKVHASMSTPIIVDGKLWGLISCHHNTPKHVPFETRYAFEVLSGLISSQLASHEREERLLHMSKRRELELDLIDLVHKGKELNSSIFTNSDTILDLFGAGGIAMVLGNDYHHRGEVPSEKQTQELVKWLRIFNKDKVFATRSLVAHLKVAEAYKNIGSGLLAIQFSHSPLGFLLLFRPEIVHTVKWGGNPNDAINFEDDKQKYHPRNSFKQWQEKVEFTSMPWEEELIGVSKTLRTVMLEKMLIDLQE
ncbi:GAF domain-containing protein [Porifericola rhodea]|uniref:GAF domain-containing protein n=1 Tax=Porifericola rhodea TaxID=930972 RepID=UPI0026669180|nr:GAF domain-containing protein [Porifericola rhodea]WKN32329.1 GAF domain-containing protein [Porifericola rhodea]